MNKSNKRKNVDVINCLTKVIELNPKDSNSMESFYVYMDIVF